MGSCCSGSCESNRATSRKFRTALWVALWVNLTMFVVELAGAQHAASASLLADAIDFLGDAGNYAISLFALSLGALWLARTALIKGLTMAVYGFFVLGRVMWGIIHGDVPHATTMGMIGLLALIANASVAVLLYRFREGDANARSVRLCSRNDAYWKHCSDAGRRRGLDHNVALSGSRRGRDYGRIGH